MNHITQLARFPVKGFTAQVVETMRLSAGQTVPYDRLIAISDGTWRYDPENYDIRYKDKYIALLTHPRAALLRLRSDEEARYLTIEAPGAERFVIDTWTAGSADPFLAFLADFLELPIGDRPKLIRRTSGEFADLTILDKSGAYEGSLGNLVSVMNLASVRDLGQKMGDPALDPRRLRANISFDGPNPWEEADWLGRTIRIGSVVAKVVMATPRCAVTSVNPDTGERDRGVLQGLLRFYRHKRLGFYIDVIENGEIRPGDVVEVVPDVGETHQLVEVPFNGATLPVYVRNERVKEA